MPSSSFQPSMSLPFLSAFFRTARWPTQSYCSWLVRVAGSLVRCWVRRSLRLLSYAPRLFPLRCWAVFWLAEAGRTGEGDCFLAARF